MFHRIFSFLLFFIILSDTFLSCDKKNKLLLLLLLYLNEILNVKFLNQNKSRLYKLYVKPDNQPIVFI
jgi:hypothetical protein